ncbi:MAG: mRNA surveillance protein pelota [Candidatus Aenigmatarchaeota archaeon]|nr:MAG: mRNA surveillance protein pelota [Candidatus Aenigmarchaeota archaeon]
MKILKLDRKKRFIQLKIENPEDLWHLEKILETGDIITSKTLRKTSVKREDKIEYGKKIPVTIGIKAEKWELRPEMHSLRITGPILSGPKDVITLRSYHTHQIEPGNVLKIEKEKWKPYQLERLKKAKVKQPEIFVCVIDREQADFALLKESGVHTKGTVYFRKVFESEDRSSFYREIIKTLKDSHTDIIILAGPGFEKENLYKFIQEKEPELSKKIFLESCSDTGISGIKEVIKKSSLKVLKEMRLKKETEILERFFEELSKEGLVAYGRKETQEALSFGAIETLLVSEEKIHDFEDFMQEAEKQRAKIIIISSEHENGERFLHLGGIGALLRFSIKVCD